MRKLTLSVVLTTTMSLSVFANNSVDDKTAKDRNPNLEKTEKIILKKNGAAKTNEVESPLKSITCSVTVHNANGVTMTYSATAGNIFSSLEGARQRCAKKLAGFGEPDSYIIN